MARAAKALNHAKDQMKELRLNQPTLETVRKDREEERKRQMEEHKKEMEKRELAKNLA